jgi:uncharacterized protein YozE (UPF0346 family)
MVDLNYINSLGDVMPSDDEDDTLVQSSKYYTIDSFQDFIQSKNLKSKLSIFNNNSRSLIKHKSDYDNLFDALSKTNNFTFDILTFNETWLDNSLANLVQFHNYSSLFVHKSGPKEGGGIAIFVKEGIRFKVRDDLQFPEEKKAQYDSLFIEIMPNDSSNHTLHKNIILGVIYRSPRYSSIPDLTESLQHILENVVNEHKDIVLTGDFNIDLLQYNSITQVTNFLDQLISLNLIPKITLPTRVTHSSATLIDHIYCNMDIHTAGTIMSDITDHFSNFIFCDKTIQNTSKPKQVSYRVINNQTMADLNQALENERWNDVYSANDANIAYQNFLSIYLNLINTLLPMKTVSFNKSKHKIQPWMTRGLLISMKNKEKLYIKMLKGRNSENFRIFIDTRHTFPSIAKPLKLQKGCIGKQNLNM